MNSSLFADPLCLTSTFIWDGQQAGHLDAFIDPFSFFHSSSARALSSGFSPLEPLPLGNVSAPWPTLEHSLPPITTHYGQPSPPSLCRSYRSAGAMHGSRFMPYPSPACQWSNSSSSVNSSPDPLFSAMADVGLDSTSISPESAVSSPTSSISSFTPRMVQVSEPVPLLPCGSKTCPFCDFPFKRKADLHRHVKSHYPPDYKPLCGGLPLGEAIKAGVDLETANMWEFEGVVYAGGCMSVFSRTDSLKRHLKNSRKDVLQGKKANLCVASIYTPYNVARLRKH